MCQWLCSGIDERFKLAFDRAAYESSQCHLYEPFSERWLQYMPKVLFVRATSGHAGAGICDAARGYLLPEKFTGELAHGSWLKNVSSIVANGLLAGGIVGDRANNFFSVCDWRGQPASAFDRSPTFTGPEKVPHEPRPNCDAIFLFNFDLMCEMGLEPRQNRKRSVTTKSGESVPPECLEAVFCLLTGACYYFNPRFADKYPHLKAVQRSPVELGKPRGSAETAPTPTPTSTAASSKTPPLLIGAMSLLL